jgi:hypothetical protein
MEYVMHSKLAVGSAAALMGIATFAFTTTPRAQSAREAELIGFHQLCNKGDRKACIRFGIMPAAEPTASFECMTYSISLLGENRERHAEWRKLHADWWWWEH